MGIIVNGHNVNNRRCVDDTALIANGEDTLQKLVDIVIECSNKAGKVINIKKTKAMVLSKQPDRDKKVNIKIEGESLEQVEQLKYLGTQATEVAKSKAELISRTGASNTKFSMMSTILTSKQLSIEHE